MHDAIYADMLAKIEENNFTVHKVYPVDLICDRAHLERHANVGASIAWVVGDTHTHIISLGLEPEQNELVHCFTHLSSKDKYYLIQIGHGSYTFKELNREKFGALSTTKIPYRKVGTSQDFTLYKGATRIAHCVTQRTGRYDNLVFNVSVTPTDMMSALDRSATEFWCNRNVSEAGGSIFNKREIVWNEAGHLTQLRAA